MLIERCKFHSHTRSLRFQLLYIVQFKIMLLCVIKTYICLYFKCQSPLSDVN